VKYKTVPTFSIVLISLEDSELKFRMTFWFDVYDSIW